MDKNWIVYDEPPPMPRNRLYMSINKAHEIMINRNAYEELGSPEAVLLMYNGVTDSIAIKRVDPRETNAFPLRAKGDSGNYVVGAKPLCVKHEIKYNTTVQFLEVKIEGDAFIASLRKTRKIVKRRSPDPKRRH